MPTLKVLGWMGFFFLASGLVVVLFYPPEWRSLGCGAIMTAVTLYGAGLFLVARQVARIRRRANDMLQRVADELEGRKRGGP